jgi:uncharacterized DUF497 family protein
MNFVWDEDKAASNEAKHGVSFTEAATVFNDLLSVTIADPDHSAEEERWILIGHSHRDRLLFVAYAEREGNLRLISARKATRLETRVYEESL